MEKNFHTTRKKGIRLLESDPFNSRIHHGPAMQEQSIVPHSPWLCASVSGKKRDPVFLAGAALWID
jgi:hypothetical protein